MVQDFARGGTEGARLSTNNNWLIGTTTDILSTAKLQVHQATVLASVMSTFNGLNLPPLWEPSQNGWPSS